MNDSFKMIKNFNGGNHTGFSNSYKAEKKVINSVRINEERIVYALSCLVGEDVAVKLHNGGKIMGTFHGFDPMSRGGNKAIDIALKNTRDVSKEEGVKQVSGRPLVIFGSEYHYISAHGIKGFNARRKSDGVKPTVKGVQGSKFKTDAEISASKAKKIAEPLTEWRPDECLDDSQLCVLDEMEPVEWDQFESNSREYGVVSTYDENLYTIPLDLNEIPVHVQERAEMLAADTTRNTGEPTYSQLESYLECDDIPFTDSDVEAIAQKALSKSGKDLKKKDRQNINSRYKPRLAPQEYDSNVYKSNSSQKAQSINPMEDCSSNSLQTSLSKDMPDSEVKEDYVVNSKGKSTEKQLFHQIAANTLNLEPAVPRVDGVTKLHRTQNEKKGEKYTEDGNRRAEKNEFIIASQKIDEKLNQSSSQMVSNVTHKANTILRKEDDTSNKKSFKFNPNASSFTPYSVNENTVSTVTPKVLHERVDVVPKPELGASAPPFSCYIIKCSEFKSFTPMQFYPSLDLHEFRRVDNKNFPEQQSDDRWPNCSDMSYKTILGDLSVLQFPGGILPIRPTQPHIVAPGAMSTTVMFPQATQLPYPTYQIGAMPLNVVPYGPHIASTLFNGARQNVQIMQNHIVGRRIQTQGNDTQLYVQSGDVMAVKSRSVE